MGLILQTERLQFRELETSRDAVFICELLNTPKFLKYIGDRGVHTVEEATEAIENRYRKSYVDNGFGFYVVEARSDNTPLGICGYVQRDTLPGVDLGFAFLPEHERKGYGYESASAMLKHGVETLGFKRILAITSLDNDASGALLGKLGFTFDKVMVSGDEQLKLFTFDA